MAKNTKTDRTTRLTVFHNGKTWEWRMTVAGRRVDGDSAFASCGEAIEHMNGELELGHGIPRGLPDEAIAVRQYTEWQTRNAASR